MLAAYNAGPGRYEAYAAGARGLPLETTRYVARIAPAIGTATSNARAQTTSPTLLPDRRAWMQAALFVRNMVSGNSELDPSDRDKQTDRPAVSYASVRRSPGGVSADAQSAPSRPDRPKPATSPTQIVLDDVAHRGVAERGDAEGEHAARDTVVKSVN